jgi:hypothetical protein
MIEYELGEIIYENPLASAADIDGFRMEGKAAVSFPQGRMRLENALDPELGQAANYLFWCPHKLPDNIAVSWDFLPIREPGLAMMWIASNGMNGRDLFDPLLAERAGEYKQYHHGDINALHASYFRRKAPSERSFQTCNLRKSFGFHMVHQGADPLPSMRDVHESYPIQIIKSGPNLRFSIRQLTIYDWMDDSQSYGEVLEGGYLGFRQMAPLIAEYSNLVVREVKPL